MKPEIVNLPAMRVVGLSYVGKNENLEIPAMWGAFNPRFGEIQQEGKACYGLCLPKPEDAETGAFEYVACTAATTNAPIPPGMVEKHVPAHKYAKFKHVGAPHLVHQTFHKIYSEWLPENGLVADGGYDLELYDEDFMPASGEPVMYVLVPIK